MSHSLGTEKNFTAREHFAELSTGFAHALEIRHFGPLET